MAELINIVNEQDEIIGSKKRGEEAGNDIYQVAALWVVNSNEDILLAKRVDTKKYDPGKWGPAVAGTVEQGETYLQNIKKETEEEIGITDCDIKKEEKTFKDYDNRHFTQWFSAVLDLPIEKFTKQNSEVAELKWFAEEEVIELCKNTPEIFVSRFCEITRQFLK